MARKLKVGIAKQLTYIHLKSVNIVAHARCYRLHCQDRLLDYRAAIISEIVIYAIYDKELAGWFTGVEISWTIPRWWAMALWQTPRNRLAPGRKQTQTRITYSG